MSKDELQDKLIILASVALSITVMMPLKPLTASEAAKYLIGFTVLFSIIIKLAIKRD